MMQNWKMSVRSRKAWIARQGGRVWRVFFVVKKALVENRLLTIVRSRFRKTEVYAAHKVKMPVAEFDMKRRAFLKYTLFGGTLFLAGKYLTPLINALRGDTVLSEKTFQNFKLTETGKQLLVTDDDGNEILTIDKESF